MTKDLSKKIRWNSYYKRILLFIGVLVLIYTGFNGKLRMDEQRYLTNLTAHSWKQDDYKDSGSYTLQEDGILYATYIMEPGVNPIPLKEYQPGVIARKDNLVIKVKAGNKQYVVISEANDPKVTHEAIVEVDKAGNLSKSESSWSDEKKQSVNAYLKKYQKEYVDLLKNTVHKRQEIVD